MAKKTTTATARKTRTRTKKSASKRTSKKKASKRAGATRNAEGSLKLPRKTEKQKKRAGALYDDLLEHYPDAHCELDYANAHELLIATILSAQSTDAGVNKATPALFKRFPTPEDYANVSPAEIEQYISSIGLFRNKAKSVYGAMKMIVEEHGGRVPDTMEELIKLPGAARKTANVVLGNAFGKSEGVVVDTHVARISRRYGLTKNEKTDKIELDLMALYPPERWTMLPHLFIFHGRRACKARIAVCGEHPVCMKYRTKPCC